MPRKNVRHYAGASSRIEYSALSKLGRAYMVQPKIDGAYCHLHLDATGCIARVSSRTGRDYSGDQVSHLLGQLVGYPGAVLIGEFEAHTTAGNQAAQEFGARRVHLFDLAFGYDTRPLHHQPYSERRAELCRMQALVDTYGPGQSWHHSEHGIRDKSTGWFATKSHRSTALTPIVPQFAPNATDELWDQVRAGRLEGLVAVAQNAPLGRRGAKRKCKPVRSIDALVMGVDSRTVLCLYGAGHFTVSKGPRNIQKGDMVEVKHDGFYDSTTPRFPRIERVRYDIMVDC
jgi:ATP-dependent DNA ligase